MSIHIDNLGARYGRTEILAGITTPQFQPGETIAVIGPNAAGKSTLFKRIAGLLHGPGVVMLAGGADGGAISFMPQDSHSSAVLTVYESVILARKQGSGLRVSAGDLGIVDETMAVLGLEPIAGRNVGDLSGGQRQLVGIAQTLVREPRILLMDEPTSALDVHRQIEVLSLVRDLARERQMVIFVALHDLNQALRFADHAMVIANRGLHACGPVADIVTPDMLRAVYGIEARIEPCSKGMRHVIVDGVVKEFDHAERG